MTDEEGLELLNEIEARYRSGECGLDAVIKVTEELYRETGTIFVTSIRTEPWWFQDYAPQTSRSTAWEDKADPNQTLHTQENGELEFVNEKILQEDTKMDNNIPNTPDSDAIAARRRALAEALRQGEPVVVTPAGAVEVKEEAADNGLSGIQVPDGKLA